MKRPRVLFLDLETLPNLQEGLKVWNQMSDYPGRTLKADISTIICFGYKWLGQKQTHCKSLWNYQTWKKDVNNDLELVRFALSVINEADIIVTHNGKRFDYPFLNTRIQYWRSRGHTDLHLVPRIPHVDTCSLLRRNFYLFNNRLNNAGKFLEQGEKMKHSGWNLWVDVHNRDAKAMSKMERYCKQDVNLLSKVFKELQSVAKDIPNMNLISDERVCPRCASRSLKRHGIRATRLGVKQRYLCQSCGATSLEDKNKVKVI